MGKHPSMPTEETIGNGYSYLTDVSPKDKPLDTHKVNTEKISKLYSEIGYDQYATRTESCSQFLEFSIKKDDSGKSLLKLFSARFCRVRHCPTCQWRRMLMWRAKFFQGMPRLLAEYPTHRFLFLTLTIRNCQLADLRENLNFMNNAWRRMIKRKVFPAVGYVKSTEVTRGEYGTAHPHFHIILMVKSSYFSGHGYLSHEKWTKLWKSCLKIDYTPIVNVKVVRDKNSNSSNNISGGIALAICETLKYSVKESDLLSDADWLQGITQQLDKTKAISLGGKFKEYISDKEPENLINSGIEETLISDEDAKVWFFWDTISKRYRFQ